MSGALLGAQANAINSVLKTVILLAKASPGCNMGREALTSVQGGTKGQICCSSQSPGETFWGVDFCPFLLCQLHPGVAKRSMYWAYQGILWFWLGFGYKIPCTLLEALRLWGFPLANTSSSYQQCISLMAEAIECHPIHASAPWKPSTYTWGCGSRIAL